MKDLKSQSNKIKKIEILLKKRTVFLKNFDFFRIPLRTLPRSGSTKPQNRNLHEK
jgi:hypothetical protein